ncbi:hypothetical protein KQH61_04075 [bacterium]|nr:hypothetical protein [bacterium]MCB2179080.1 hypothetical protein [bacterium]
MGGDIERMKILEEKMRERRNWRMSLFTSYQGDYVEISLSDKAYRNYRILSFLLIATIVPLHIGAGFVNNPGMKEVYEILPYIAALGAIVYYLLFWFQLPKKKNLFRMGEVTLLFSRLRNATLLLWLCLTAILGSGFVFLRDLPAELRTTDELIFLAIIGAEMLAAFFLLVKQIGIARNIKVI